MILNINTGLPLPNLYFSDLVKNVIFLDLNLIYKYLQNMCMDILLLVTMLNTSTFRFDMLFRCQAVQLLVTATYPYPTDFVKIKF